jgi:hypothetical protein
MRHGTIAQRCSVAAIAAILGLGAAQTAHAAITSAKLATTQSSHSGGCPATIPFTGSITGNSGTTFTYTFRRVVNGVPQLVNGGLVTMPASGSIAVKDAITITASTQSGEVTTNQILVQNISGGQHDQYSNPVDFSVTCRFTQTPVPGSPNLVQRGVALHPQWVGLREYEYKWVGLTSFIPERGAAPCANLCIGWYHLHNGDSFWLYHWNTYDRAFLGYDLSAAKGWNISKAALSLTVVEGDAACYGGAGRAVLTRTPIEVAATQTFHAPYPDDADFAWPTPAQIDTKSVVVTVTSIVQGWLSDKMPNQGFVLRGRVEDNGSNDNDGCSVAFARDVVLMIEK